MKSKFNIIRLLMLAGYDSHRAERIASRVSRMTDPERIILARVARYSAAV